MAEKFEDQFRDNEGSRTTTVFREGFQVSISGFLSTPTFFAPIRHFMFQMFFSSPVSPSLGKPVTLSLFIEFLFAFCFLLSFLRYLPPICSPTHSFNLSFMP